MAQCGLPIPAAPGSRVPLLRRAGGDGGRRAGPAGRPLHLQRPAAAASRRRGSWAGPDSLILLDELGSGTDPEEGAALAEALLEGLLEKGSLGVITTHLGAARRGGAGAAGRLLRGDGVRSRRPAGRTFRLVPGPPGASEALALARRLGLPAEWLDRAEARLGSEHRDLRRLIAEVERVRQELAETRERLEIERSDAEKLRRRLADERAALEDERRSVSGKMKAELEQFRRDTTERLRREEARLRERFEEGRRQGAGGRGGGDACSPRRPPSASRSRCPRGRWWWARPVRHLGLGWQGVLEKLEGGRAEVLVRGKRVRAHPRGAGPRRPAAEGTRKRAGGPALRAGAPCAAARETWTSRWRARST